jgi:beta-lactamase class A
MHQSRRQFLKATAAAGALANIPWTTTALADKPVRADDIIMPFQSLPGDKAIKVVATGKNGKPVFSAELNSDKQLFVASAIKTFALCEALRQADSTDIDDELEHKELTLDASVWSLGSLTFNPPDLTGLVSERTTLEAMVTRSDNTATDMIFKLVGAENIRRFLAEAGLTQTLVPDSTRVFTGYVFGADNYKTITWKQLLQVVRGPLVHPFLNDVQTLASSADDLVSYYSRALQGNFFQHRETLNEFRRILTLCDFIYLIPLPLGVSAYAKSGNADFPGFHARSIAGAIFFSGHWVYFAFIVNWDAAELNDEETVRQFFAAIQHALVRIRNSLSK